MAERFSAPLPNEAEVAERNKYLSDVSAAERRRRMQASAPGRFGVARTIREQNPLAALEESMGPQFGDPTNDAELMVSPRGGATNIAAKPGTLQGYGQQA